MLYSFGNDGLAVLYLFTTPSCFDELVKSPKPRWVCKTLHIRGTEISYYFGVLKYVEMI